MKRGAPLRRRTPLARGPMRRRRGSTSYSRRERDTDRMGWCRTQPCALAEPPIASWAGPLPDACRRHVEAHHAGAHGLSNKSPDDTVIPLCDHHHDDLTDRRGVFSGWPIGALRVWQDAMIAIYQARYAARTLPIGAGRELF